MPQVATAAPAGLPAVVVPMAKKKKPKPTVVFSSTLKLVVDVNPDLPRAKNWKIKLQRKSGSKWRTVGIYRTQGAAETRAFGVKAGTYRVKVYARPGYRSVTTKAYLFKPTPPVPPVLPDTTAPGVVTGLAMVGRTATSLTLAWTNPTDADLAAVIVRRADGGTAPATATDGVAVVPPTATATSVTDTGLAVSTLYAYAVFTRDATGNTSPGVPLATSTLGPSVVATTRVSVRSDGGQAAGVSFDTAISADGRWIAFGSSAADLVDNDTNGAHDVFLFDRDTGTTQRVSDRSNGSPATSSSGGPALSADGRWIAYGSSAANLVDNDTNGADDVFLYDRDTGTTQRVSVRSDGGQATGPSMRDPAISANGRWIAYSSGAPNLIDNDTNGTGDIFLYDRQTGSTQRVSVRSDGGQATGESYNPAISADGRWITYITYASNLVDGDTNNYRDVFLYDRQTGTTQRVSVRSDGGQATGESYNPAISAEGRWITYSSGAANLVDNDTNGTWDVFLSDRDTGTTRRVSVRNDGGQATGNSFTTPLGISADGRWITFYSSAANLVDNDTNGAPDVFLFDRDTGTTRRVSLRGGGGQANSSSLDPAISGDGRWITYASDAADLVEGDTNGVRDVFLTRMW
jgi:Tol biopolymer transport system component